MWCFYTKFIEVDYGNIQYHKEVEKNELVNPDKWQNATIIYQGKVTIE